MLIYDKEIVKAYRDFLTNKPSFSESKKLYALIKKNNLKIPETTDEIFDFIPILKLTR